MGKGERLCEAVMCEEKGGAKGPVPASLMIYLEKNGKIPSLS
jgi:hypothetical protein